MKQLLQTLGSQHMVAGLYNRAYLVTGTAGSDDKNYTVHELLPPNVPLEQDYEHRDANEVQAVAIMSNKQEIWCAVSRMNKTLSLYCFNTKNDDTTAAEMDPRTVHKTTKRVCCMDFAQVPSNTDGSTPLNVIIAGDLTGDATAYPLILENDTNKATNSSPSCRVLLGHTASVLTGVKVVPDNDNKMAKILTSDRDEKIRVSRFPQTFVVEGYLLGHTAFVAAMDVLAEKDWCVTCSGDGTLRLWDYSTCQELAIAQLPNTNGKEEKDANQATTNNVQDKDEQETLVPTGISASHPDGEYVGVIFDKCTTVHLYRIVSSDERNEIQPCQELECPSQPLAIRFLENTLYVLVGEPDYCLAFSLQSGTVFEKDEESSCCKALRQVASAEKIEMPTSLMETDRKGRARIKVKPHEDRINLKPWNNVERKQIAKQANARRHKRKRLEKQK